MSEVTQLYEVTPANERRALMVQAAEELLQAVKEGKARDLVIAYIGVDTALYSWSICDSSTTHWGVCQALSLTVPMGNKIP